jgi:hypothetical protein
MVGSSTSGRWPDKSGQRQDVLVASDVVILPDGGRRLSWYEFGDPDGSPVIYTAGTPVSGLGGGCYDEPGLPAHRTAAREGAGNGD